MKAEFDCVSGQDVEATSGIIKDTVSYFTVVCAWCRRVLKEGNKDSPVSHGICEHCLEKELSEAGIIA